MKKKQEAPALSSGYSEAYLRKGRLQRGRLRNLPCADRRKGAEGLYSDLSMLEGRHILTVEGLSEEEKEILSARSGEAGAVQCGFCIPGMVISAKGLIDKNPNPTRAEAAYAIRNNICRCTGYKKIIDGILLAAKYRREGLPERQEYAWRLGERVPRVDVREKVLGYGEYPDDIHVEG